MDRPIGVFDSGIGGISVLKQMIEIMPNENYIYYADSKYAPYGVRDNKYIIDRCEYICEELIKKGVKAIVIACNTATSVAVEILREKYKHIDIIGIEPAVKIATKNSKEKNILLMATNVTLNEKKLEKLIMDVKGDNTIIKQPCPELVEIIESNKFNNKKIVEKQLNLYFDKYKNVSKIVLGCTHFIFYKNYIRTILGNSVEILDGNLGISNNVKRILEEKKSLNIDLKLGNVEILTSLDKDTKEYNMVMKLCNDFLYVHKY